MVGSLSATTPSRGQPTVPVRSSLVSSVAREPGVEALVRWRHPTRGLLGPIEFIHVAEETGLIVPIGAYVLRTACAQVGAWDRLGGPAAGAWVAVNFSPRQLRSPELVEMIGTALLNADLMPNRLHIEITESILVDEDPAVVDLLLLLKALGVRISIDDFGTGYSSLSYLRRLPVDTLKIAKPFVDVVTRDERDEALARAVVNLAESLKLDVVAEGIEQEAQLATLRGMGCRMGQGFLVSRPLPPDELLEAVNAGTLSNAA